MAFLIDLIQRFFGFGDYHPLKLGGKARDPRWRKVRDEVVREIGKCQIHGGTKNLEAHHIVPFAKAPLLELVRSNLIIVCRDCHFAFCHLFDWTSENADIAEDSRIWREKITHRP